ncbi:hypothetical protein [Neptunomonas concharum]|uniref:hypothetical protein n=1 Tax=Neptunomonas concharum TaxID=1031538 RepID=UPI00147736CF|nr:hypothetical protein [Neptunomonas concharum]
MILHRVALLIIIACWLFLPAILEWWLALEHVLLITFIIWGVITLLLAIADIRKQHL